MLVMWLPTDPVHVEDVAKYAALDMPFATLVGQLSTAYTKSGRPVRSWASPTSCLLLRALWDQGPCRPAALYSHGDLRWPHRDDLEFGTSSAIARWTAQTAGGQPRRPRS
jgi:hypothetical protein